MNKNDIKNLDDTLEFLVNDIYELNKVWAEKNEDTIGAERIEEKTKKFI